MQNNKISGMKIKEEGEGPQEFNTTREALRIEYFRRYNRIQGNRTCYFQ